LNTDDFSFLDSKIRRYDISKVGSEIHTYYDYIRYTYKILQNEYRNEYIYKNTIINDLLLRKYGLKNTILINEFRVGNSIADVVMFNGTSKAFEIKTELDSARRLDSQLDDYMKIFQECYVITHESLTSKYLLGDSRIGIIELAKHKNSVLLKEVRPAQMNNTIDSDTLIKAIRTSEYKNIVKQYFGSLPVMNSFNMFEMCRNLIRQIPSDQLHKLFIAELKKRKTNTGIVNQFPKELRHVFLAMNISQKCYYDIELKLNQKINL